MVTVGEEKNLTSDEEHDPDQTWYWTPEWQATEREADENSREGRVESFDSPEELLEFLRKRTKKD